MLKISGYEANIKTVTSEYSDDSLETKIINTMAASKDIYKYSSLNQLKFEVTMRKNIVASSIELNDGNMKFKVFKEAFCNPKFWERTEEGGFKLKTGAASSQGINDIFKNSSKYGTECSTAIVMLYYKAILNIYPEDLFDKLFDNIILLNWHYFDNDLRVFSSEIEGDFIPGDCLYFDNPDYNPKEHEWQGENAIDLGNEKYYGHGIGIENANTIIKSLNKHRKPHAEKSAYLTKNVARPNFRHLADIYINSLERLRLEMFRYYPFYK